MKSLAVSLFIVISLPCFGQANNSITFEGDRKALFTIIDHYTLSDNLGSGRSIRSLFGNTWIIIVPQSTSHYTVYCGLCSNNDSYYVLDDFDEESCRLFSQLFDNEVIINDYVLENAYNPFYWYIASYQTPNKLRFECNSYMKAKRKCLFSKRKSVLPEEWLKAMTLILYKLARKNHES